jgi:phospholipid-binding lipoprotein MlaA
MKIKIVVPIVFSVFLFNCSLKPEVMSTAHSIPIQSTETEVPNDVMQAPESKSKTLSNYKPTTIQTSNGLITIEPTVISATDQIQAGDDGESGVQIAEYSDPLEFINRPIFAFNNVAYKYALIPLAKGYNYALPQPARDSVSNVFSNIREPLNFINNTLTGDIAEAGNNLGRFLINSTIGLLGLFDPADALFSLEAKPQNFSQTLMNYGVASGVYVVLPLLGQSDVRNTASIITEGFVYPLNYVLGGHDNTIARTVGSVGDFSTQMDTYVTLFNLAEDPYLYFRNLYIQTTNRDEMALDRLQIEVNVSGISNNE